jgi:hypothetical protein
MEEVETRPTLEMEEEMKFVVPLVLLMTALFAGAAVVQEEAPSGPINLSASGDYEGAVATASLRWQDESDNELGFEIVRADNNGEYRVVGFVGANTTRYKDKIGKYITGSFVYKVRAFNKHGKSEDSNIASVWF